MKMKMKTGMKGTGRWTIQEAAERSVAAPTMAAALDARYLSARKVKGLLCTLYNLVLTLFWYCVLITSYHCF